MATSTPLVSGSPPVHVDASATPSTTPSTTPTTSGISDENAIRVIATLVAVIYKPILGAMAGTYFVVEAITANFLDQAGWNSGDKITKLAGAAINTFVATGAAFAVGGIFGYATAANIPAAFAFAIAAFAIKTICLL